MVAIKHFDRSILQLPSAVCHCDNLLGKFSNRIMYLIHESSLFFCAVSTNGYQLIVCPKDATFAIFLSLEISKMELEISLTAMSLQDVGYHRFLYNSFLYLWIAMHSFIYEDMLNYLHFCYNIPLALSGCLLLMRAIS